MFAQYQELLEPLTCFYFRFRFLGVEDLSVCRLEIAQGRTKNLLHFHKRKNIELKVSVARFQHSNDGVVKCNLLPIKC